ncbi:MAG TPA: SDR family oxidoreductase, partial [Cyclobacteriaceae bacterium]|nr:SDR family oxidoreductase [Cyclobacteriaceae bacterium]
MKYALITGASKGIGKAIAWELAAKGYNLLLVARSESLLREGAEAIKNKHAVSVDYLPVDLSESQSALKIKEWCTSKNYPVSILINNAGYALWGNFEKLRLEEQTNMMTLNMQAVVNLSYEMLPILRKEKQAYILNVSSTTAYQAIPTLSIYAATKVFVLLFTRGLRQELIDTNVSVSCLSPGTTKSEFMDRAGMEALKPMAEKFEMSAEAVAKIAVKGMFAKKAEII